MDNHVATNRSLWDGWTQIHLRAPSYDVDGFRKGRNALKPIELEEVGDVRGQSLLHLQCHFGLDTLSWTRLGAQVTGTDFSPRAIDAASSLASECGLDAKFVCCDLYDLPHHLKEQFDIVFTSYGVLTWLPDIVRWGQVVAHFLRPGGRFHIVEYHPVLNAFDPHAPEEAFEFKGSYFPRAEPFHWTTRGSYADPDADFTHDGYEWPHTLGSIVSSLTDCGLRIEFLHEFPFCITECFPGLMRRDQKGWWHMIEHDGALPLMFSLKALKPE